MKKKNIILYGFSLLVGLFSLLTIAPSKLDVKANESEFNSKNCVKDLQVISDKPHSVFDHEEHEKVRVYLKDRLVELVGSENVEERNYATNAKVDPNTTYVQDIDVSEVVNDESFTHDYDIKNLVASLPGKNEKGILLVAHYDSRGHIKRNGELAKSCGAGDDGYGVVTILEMLRYIKINNIELENSIYVLLADAEETGMYGSLLETKNQDLMDKTSFVINIEARGMDGASYMFETSPNNSKVIDLYNKSKARVTYSIAPAVYQIMTNFTDFTNFLAIGKKGLNFTTLNDIEDYHVPSDKYENVNSASLQHYGNHILPILVEFVSDAKYTSDNYFESKTDAVFFNLLPNVFISYNEVLAVVFAFVLLASLVAYIILNVKNIKVSMLFKKLGMSLLFVLASVVLGLIVSMYVGRLNGYAWNLTNVRFEGSKTVTSLFMVVMSLLFIHQGNKVNKTDEEREHFLLATTSFNVLLLVVSSLLLSGASFVFLFSSLLGIIYLYLAKYLNNKKVLTACLFVSIFLFISLFLPLMASLLYALTIGGLLAFALLTFIPFMPLMVMFDNYLK